MIIATIKMIFTDFVSKVFNRSSTDDLKRQSDEALHRLSVSEPSEGSQSAASILTNGQTSQIQEIINNTSSVKSNRPSQGGSIFERAASIILTAEGSYSNDPNDPGGPTMRGVTWKTFNSHANKLGLPKVVYSMSAPTQSMKDKIKKDMTSMITRDIALKIYRFGYWDNNLCEIFASGGYPKTALALFDISINSGPGNIKKRLKEALSTTSNDLLSTARSSGLSDYELANKVLDAQHRFRQSLKTWPKYKNGWTNRWKHLKKEVETF